MAHLEVQPLRSHYRRKLRAEQIGNAFVMPELETEQALRTRWIGGN